MREFDYDAAYFENMLHMYSGSAGKIAETRWDFVKEAGARTILDFGCGCNFMTIFAPDGTDVDSYDIGHIDDNPYPQTGIRRDHYDLVLFHDVLEHIDWENNPDAKIEEIVQKTRWISVTVPMLPDGQPLEEWKHYKPGEHLTYFTGESLDKFFEERGFVKAKSGYPECPPRIDILSVLYRREDEPLRASQSSATSTSSIPETRKVSEV